MRFKQWIGLICYLVILATILYILIIFLGPIGLLIEVLLVLLTVIPEKIRRFIFGEPKTPIDVDRLGKVIAEEVKKKEVTVPSASEVLVYEIKRLPDKEIVKHYSNENLIKYNGKKIPQALVDHVPLGLTEDQMQFIDLSETFKLSSEIESVKERLLNQVKHLSPQANYYESTVWRLHDFDRDNRTMKFIKSYFSEYCVTNEASGLGFVVHGEQLLYLLEDGKQLKALKESKAENGLGIGVMIITADKYTFLQRRSEQTLVYPNLLGISAGGIMSMTADPNPSPNPFNAIRVEIQEELGIESSEITDLRYVGLTRELTRAGKPEMFFIAKTTLNLLDVFKRFGRTFRDGCETALLEEMDLKQIREPFPEKDMSSAAKAGIYFLFHYQKYSE